MKNIVMLLIFSALLILTSCEEDDKFENINCEVLTEALVNSNNENVKAEIDKLTVDLKPHVSDNDNFGHSQNLNTLIDRLNSQCKNIEASLICYACIYTLPPQSEIEVVVDSLGIEVVRIIDILTPDDEILSFHGMH